MPAGWSPTTSSGRWRSASACWAPARSSSSTTPTAACSRSPTRSSPQRSPRRPASSRPGRRARSPTSTRTCATASRGSPPTRTSRTPTRCAGSCSTSRPGGCARSPDRRSALVRDHVGRQLDRRAVAPQPLEGVEAALLLVLHVHDDVAVVDEHPAAVALALAPDRLGVDLAELVLDLVDDRLHLPLVGRGGEQERVGDRQLLRDIEGDDLLGELVRGRTGGGVDELDG